VVRTTKAMLLIEERHGGKSIREILKGAFEQYGSQRAVAKALGIDQSTLSAWLIRLQLVQWSTLKEMSELEEAS
jgi:transposase-like protein